MLSNKANLGYRKGLTISVAGSTKGSTLMKRAADLEIGSTLGTEKYHLIYDLARQLDQL
jgi:hypothetical protein